MAGGSIGLHENCLQEVDPPLGLLIGWLSRAMDEKSWAAVWLFLKFGNPFSYGIPTPIPKQGPDSQTGLIEPCFGMGVV